MADVIEAKQTINSLGVKIKDMNRAARELSLKEEERIVCEFIYSRKSMGDDLEKILDHMKETVDGKYDQYLPNPKYTKRIMKKYSKDKQFNNILKKYDLCLDRINEIISEEISYIQ